MQHRILAELNDLRRSVREMEQLIQRLGQNEQYIHGQLQRIADWKGQSADELRERFMAFRQELSARQQEIAAYIADMERVDASAGRLG
ncbi:hypothetical protein WJ0W_001779 [Paenibacillus melissococcoides]|uniref:WXG100 family type VII secretion target n=1 Tax=Paenibacillus melissococcoides TaxID=2912268 RepID=A0ABN8U474_9BACL|nr:MULTISPECIES: hypothetical protein [Paenibacillus]MEB9894338.1 hypothetical protein [Bacillus cereus]CAH8244545.1 hypothetical protein WJ0W_001779 [Paenibacillus melissococcoides]CAH8708301.1 hypothetical protein WDD9_001866 [Paenibacillus melissococcoides]CAH8709008.1 hypothetical protein HTL2_002151 [Paenibacillus melissococcoides]GIO78387.1 hypothetical protein J6TS7_19970 [Paenibacillus dendritiformis]